MRENIVVAWTRKLGFWTTNKSPTTIYALKILRIEPVLLETHDLIWLLSIVHIRLSVTGESPLSPLSIPVTFYLAGRRLPSLCLLLFASTGIHVSLTPILIAMGVHWQRCTNLLHKPPHIDGYPSRLLRTSQYPSRLLRTLRL
jgi:hypothetical protein